MDAAVIRLQLPAGEAFIAAFDDAADKYAARRGFADGGALFTKIASAAVRAVASAAPATIELAAREHAGRIGAVIRGHGATIEIPAAAMSAVATTASELAEPPTVDASAAIIEFSVPLG